MYVLKAYVSEEFPKYLKFQVYYLKQLFGRINDKTFDS